MPLVEFSLKRYFNPLLIIGILLVLLTGASSICNADINNFSDGIFKGIKFLQYLFPPDWSAFESLLEPAFESLLLAILGTLFGTILSVVFALFAAVNITNKWISLITRFLIGVERSVPELFILLLLIAAFGLGAMPGVIALALGCVGMLGKLFADAIEEIDKTLIESMISTGANKMQIIAFGILPEIMPQLISFSLFRLEINIRLSILLGAVGAGGIGFELDNSFAMLQYHRACSALIIVLIMVFGIEKLTSVLRDKIVNPNQLK